MNQLCGCTTPLTLAEMARGPVSCATQTNGASSTILACNWASKASRCLASNVVRALAMMASTSGLLEKPQLFDTGGAALELTKRTIAKNGSIDAKLMFTASEPCALGSLAPMRQLVYSVFHSMTSNWTSKKQSFRFCCMNSFIGNGCICPEPEVEINTLILSGLAAEYPACCIILRAASGSYLMWNCGLPRHG